MRHTLATLRSYHGWNKWSIQRGLIIYFIFFFSFENTHPVPAKMYMNFVYKVYIAHGQAVACGLHHQSFIPFHFLFQELSQENNDHLGLFKIWKKKTKLYMVELQQWIINYWIEVIKDNDVSQYSTMTNLAEELITSPNKNNLMVVLRVWSSIVLPYYLLLTNMEERTCYCHLG